MQIIKKLLTEMIGESRGSIAITVIILLVIIGAVMMAGGIGGILPKPPKVSSPIREAVPDPDSFSPEEKQSLQLKTFPFKECTETITMDLLLDRTGSMENRTPSGATKISRLKEAVLALTNNLSDNSIIGIQSFASPNNTNSITNDVPIDYYRNNKDQIPPAVNSLQANGTTPTHDALAYSYPLLQTAVQQFPDRQFNFIFVSDGQPVPTDNDPGTQDPRDYNPNPADQIKALGVNVYTLGIFSSGQASDPELAELLRSIASKPENYFEATTADETQRLLTAISERICEGETRAQD